MHSTKIIIDGVWHGKGKTKSLNGNGIIVTTELKLIKNIEKISSNVYKITDTFYELNKTHDRLNLETNEIINNKTPMIYDDGYEWSENFDGKIINDIYTFYFNLKFVCDIGGTQTRTLRETYHFIKCQLEHLIKFDTKKIYFINILDGDTCYNNMNKYYYLLNKEKYRHIKKYIFIGSLYEFQKSHIIKIL